MNHFYQNIGEDWFTYPNLYKMAVDKFDNAKFVEIGSWKGRSSVFMAVEIFNSKKNIEFYCVDTWRGSIEHIGMEILNNDGLYKEFIKNIEPVSNIIKPIRMTSEEASKNFEDESLDFVFIDAAHDYESVKNDIDFWYPKIKKEGIIGGHDYEWAGVNTAVKEWAKKNNKQINLQELSWFTTK
jgi:predicted O-methyltransferase YrrM